MLLLLGHLAVNPLESTLETILEADSRHPTKNLLDESVVRVAATNTLRTGNVVDLHGVLLAYVQNKMLEDEWIQSIIKKTITIDLPANSRAMAAMSFMETISSEPMLRGSL